MGQFSLPIHPKMPEDKQLRTGGTRESTDVGSKPSLLQVQTPNEWQLSDDRSRLQNKNLVEVLCLRCIRNNLELWQLQI